MAHLPKEVIDEVIPILLNCASTKWHNRGYSLETFNVHNFVKYDATGSEEDIGIIELLNKYHFWFVSFDEFDAEFYCCLESAIKRFNKESKTIQLNLSHETGGHKRFICQSDSDNYGTYYFLITARTPEGNPFTYELPAEMIVSLTDDEKKEDNIPQDCKYVFTFPELDDMRVYQKKESLDYYTLNELGEKQNIIFSEDNYQKWDEIYEYCMNVAKLDILKQHAENEDKYAKADEPEIERLSKIISQSKIKYPKWDIIKVKNDRYKQIADVLKMKIESPEFKTFLKQLKLLSDYGFKLS